MNTFSAMHSASNRFDFARALVARTIGTLHERKTITSGAVSAGHLEAGMQSNATAGIRERQSHRLACSPVSRN